MKHRVVWTRTAWEVFLEIPEREQDLILQKIPALEVFPLMYPIRLRSRRFRRHRWFLGGDWIVYYRVADGTVYIRGLWPARIP